MPSYFIMGDLFSLGLEALAHGCNCQGVMGAGIAVEFRKRFPTMFEEYKVLCAHNVLSPGNIFKCKVQTGQTIYNLMTQQGVGRGRGATLEAVEQSVGKMVKDAEENSISIIGLPRIGAGLGGLPWHSVRSILESIGDQTNVTLVVVEYFLPKKKTTF